MMYLYPMRYFIGNMTKGFALGAGSVGAALLFRRQLRGLAVEGAKGLLMLKHGIKGVLDSGNIGLKGIVYEAKLKRINEKIERMNLTAEELAQLGIKLNGLFQEIEVRDEVVNQDNQKAIEGERQNEPL
ncbi:MAG: hypothetical protein SCK28_05910 [Bacillota bacterium]|nr:hypothetical protein [Bacillota bacterium]